MGDIAETSKQHAPESVLISVELERELCERLKTHRDSPESSEPWESVERSVFGTD